MTEARLSQSKSEALSESWVYIRGSDYCVTVNVTGTVTLKPPAVTVTFIV